jgi:hypothetical protein
MKNQYNKGQFNSSNISTQKGHIDYTTTFLNKFCNEGLYIFFSGSLVAKNLLLR